MARVSRLSAKERPSFKLPAIGGPPFPDLATAAALFRSLGHPLRLQVVLALEHETSSPTDLAQQLGVALGLSAYHVRILRAAGLLELVDTRPVRGSMQSFYRLSQRGHTALRLLATARRELDDAAEAHRPRASGG